MRRRLIYLLGFMGSGKSTTGGLLARELGWKFIDLDAEIEAAEGMSIREIFARHGEPYFRQRERDALERAIRGESVVLALGGGTFAQPGNLELIRRTGGTTIFLDCPVDELRRRCANMSNRPLFGDPDMFTRLLQERMPYYRLADYRISTAARSPREVVESILRLPIFQ